MATLATKTKPTSKVSQNLIREVSIHNFKSIQDLEISLGRVNVLIGANGSGKSNVLEAIAVLSAAAIGKLDDEFLFPRGVRVPDDPRLMRAAFHSGNAIKEIRFGADSTCGPKFDCVLEIKSKAEYPIWERNYTVHVNRDGKILKSPGPDDQHIEIVVSGQSIGTAHERPKGNGAKLMELPAPYLGTLSNYSRLIEETFGHFLIYSPEVEALRTFAEEGQIRPLGVHGQGLWKLLTTLARPKNESRLKLLKQKLSLLDWFEDFSLPNGQMPYERTLKIVDRYLDKGLFAFTQRSANEGFLFLLFYFCLFISKDTPSFFAIDNIDASLNPKLCARLMQELAELAKRYKKQVIFTTHNPAVLDGLNLHDDEQRLFVVTRSRAGHTRVDRFVPEWKNGKEPVRLSEAFLRGYVGGLPQNF